MRWNSRLATLVLGMAALALTSSAQSVKLDQEPACKTLKPASTGGPIPTSPDVLLVRYLGRANYEVAYQGKVILLDAYYDTARPPYGEPFGIKESDVTKADAIFVGHTHGDHFIDAPAIAKRTGAPVYLGPPGLNYLQKNGVPQAQIQIVRGGETIKRNGYTVQTALGIHMPIADADLAAYRAFIPLGDPITDEQKQGIADWRKAEPVANVEDPDDPEHDTTYHGTIVYAFTLDNGFRFVFSDTAGVLSGGEKALADSIHASGGKIDLAILGYLDGNFNVPRAVKITLKRVQTWQPSIFLPSHFNDNERDELPDMPTNVLFETFRDQAPNTRGIEPIFRTPVCINTKTDDFFVGYYAH